MNPIAFYVFGKPVYWYGIIIALGVLVGIYLATRYAKKLGYDEELIIDFCLWAIPISIIGARLYYVVFSWEYYSKNPGDMVKIWEGGLAIFGAVIGGVISAIIFAKRRKIDFWELCDIVSPSLILGQALGRWGNFFNQEAYGYAIKNPAWKWFPAAVFIEATGQWHMATFFYESAWNFLVFFYLLSYKKKRKEKGEIFLLYLILYSAGRVVIEGLRTDSLYWGAFRVSQLLSGVLIIVGIILFVMRRKKADSRPEQVFIDRLNEEDKTEQGDNLDETIEFEGFREPDVSDYEVKTEESEPKESDGNNTEKEED